MNATSFKIPAGGLQETWSGTNSVPIGKPVSNVDFSVMEDGPEGPAAATVGELWISGVQVAIGYQGMPGETAKKFPVINGKRCYRTGDRVRKLEDGNLEFLGRFDNQVKIRGNRVELDEIAAQFHRHPWVERAHALLLSGRRPGQQELVACIQLDPGNAPLMDGAQAASHHRSKADRTQVKAQLSSPGLRDVDGIPEADVISIPGSGSEERIEAHTYARKTYRFFDGPRARQREILKLIAAAEPGAVEPSAPDADTYRASVLDMLHAVSAHHSPERLLPKYLYASPGALYSTQIYLENDGTLGIPPGMYYFHPIERQLYLLPDQKEWNPTGLRFHLVSKTSAIQDVYQKNVKEVQLLEAGHMLGAMEQFAARHDAHVHFEEPGQINFPGQESDDDVYLGTVELRTLRQPWLEACNFYISIPEHTTMPLEPGMYKHTGQNELQRISDLYVRQNEVIAINQAVYSRADFGVAIVSGEDDPRHAYISMGYQMHKIQDNDLKFGFMSAGYSSFSGHPLPSALTIQKALGVSEERDLPSYFALGGHISDEQIEHRGMNEDSVHMTGPAEMITKDMTNYVPDYMVPDRTVLVSGFPTTPNGKIDGRALEQSPEVTAPSRSRGIVEPSTATEALLVRLWQGVLKEDDVSADDNFFQIGGDSIRVMMLLAKLREQGGITIGPETVFSNPVLNDLASAIDEGSHASRLIPLSDSRPGPATIAWPGLGGVPINLKPLALNLQTESTVYGVRASGLNPDEPIHSDVHEMARHDIELIPDRESYRLIGYSFGCRVAFEAAFQLENWGKNVESLVLVCPGNPAVELGGEPTGNRAASFENREFVAMLTSVFTGRIDPDLISEAWETVTSAEDMVRFVMANVDGFEASQVRRIVDLVSGTYEFDYSFTEMADLQLRCPVLIIKAAGDLYSSVEDIISAGQLDFDEKQLPDDHYTVLREPGVQSLAAVVREFQLKHSSAKV
ncbi:phosphopantetheine-binding protein [Arthrobacter sp. H14]|uniref:phosphopantetheine-binding protein n=1 Tax=Arthrobacter sp. H14 TaxID=1312959 RepID=UPI0020A659E9|nr:phosphopantetheine-binding protein [Arthrobacter sp. H14]